MKKEEIQRRVEELHEDVKRSDIALSELLWEHEGDDHLAAAAEYSGMILSALSKFRKVVAGGGGGGGARERRGTPADGGK